MKVRQKYGLRGSLFVKYFTFRRKASIYIHHYYTSSFSNENITVFDLVLHIYTSLDVQKDDPVMPGVFRYTLMNGGPSSYSIANVYILHV